MQKEFIIGDGFYSEPMSSEAALKAFKSRIFPARGRRWAIESEGLATESEFQKMLDTMEVDEVIDFNNHNKKLVRVA